MKTIAVKWKSFNNTTQVIGIILCQNFSAEITCRIGIAEGMDEDEDTDSIMDNGAKLEQLEALAYFPEYKKQIMDHWKKN